ncbi:MAG: NUDIX domain-containing protein [Alphaproteobacteria bacterium]|nr:NUDIX domain-containing protein [Alphaproteobacteria bacterium]
MGAPKTRADIRVKAMGVFRRGDQILVNEVREPDGTLIGFRIPGGHVEFGEKSSETLVREMREEIGAEIENLHTLATIENVFTYAGQAGHEVIVVYAADFADAGFDEQDVISAQEDDGTAFNLVWHDPDDLPDGLPLYPSGLRDYL